MSIAPEPKHSDRSRQQRGAFALGLALYNATNRSSQLLLLLRVATILYTIGIGLFVAAYLFFTMRFVQQDAALALKFFPKQLQTDDVWKRLVKNLAGYSFIVWCVASVMTLIAILHL